MEGGSLTGQRLPVRCVVVPPERAGERAAVHSEVVERNRDVGMGERRIVCEDGELDERLGYRERYAEQRDPASATPVIPGQCPARTHKPECARRVTKRREDVR